MGSDQKNAFMAIILSGLILFGWQTYFAPKQEVVQTPVTKTVAETAPVSVATPAAPVAEDFAKEAVLISAGENQFSVRTDLAVGKGVSPGEKYSFKTVTGNDFPFKIQVLEYIHATTRSG